MPTARNVDKIEAAKDASVSEQARHPAAMTGMPTLPTPASSSSRRTKPPSVCWQSVCLVIDLNRAARIMDQLCEAGVVGEEEGTKPRKVIMSMEEFEQIYRRVFVKC